MFVLAVMALDSIRNFIRRESAQDAFEYVLVIGVVVVAVLVAIATPAGTNLVNAVVEGACTGVKALPKLTVDCTKIIAP